MTLPNEPKTRRDALRAGLAVVTTGLMVGTAARPARADDKLAQNLVQYQEQPKDGAQCNKCVNWIEPNACKIVAGQINPNGWCVAFAPKEG